MTLISALGEYRKSSSEPGFSRRYLSLQCPLSLRNLILWGIKITLSTLICLSCTATEKKVTDPWDQSFTLKQDQQTPQDTSSSQVLHHVSVKSSLPLPIEVIGSRQGFEKPPSGAFDRRSSSIETSILGCRFRIRTGAVAIDQYIWTGTWVRFKMALTAGTLVHLDKKQFGYFRASVDLQVEFPFTPMEACRKLLLGHKHLIGGFHLNRSSLSLLATPDSPSVKFGKRDQDGPAYKVYLNWPRQAAKPQLLDYFDVPAHLSSPIFGGRFGKSGSYYLRVKPVLAIIPKADKALPELPNKRQPSPHPQPSGPILRVKAK